MWPFAAALLGEIVIGVSRGATVATKGGIQEAAESKKTTLVIHFAEAGMCQDTFDVSKEGNKTRGSDGMDGSGGSFIRMEAAQKGVGKANSSGHIGGRVPAEKMIKCVVRGGKLVKIGGKKQEVMLDHRS